MANTARVITKFTADGLMEIATIASPAGVSFTDVTEQVDTYLSAGDVVVVEIGNLSAAQLTALKNRAQIIALIDKDETADSDFKDTGLTKTEIRQLANLINTRFSVPLEKIKQWLDENDETLTKKKVEQLIRRLCTAKNDKQKVSRS